MAKEQGYRDINIKSITLEATGLITYEKDEKQGTSHAGKCVALVGAGQGDLTDDTDPIFGTLEMVFPPEGGVTFMTVTYQGYKIVPTTGAIVYGEGLQGSATRGVAKALATEKHSPLAIDNHATNQTVMLMR